MTNVLNDLDAVKFEKIIDEHKGHLKSIEDGIVEGVQEGVKEGVSEGLKDGVKDGLKEGFDKGFINIGEGDSKDIIDKITEGTKI
jgi:flagellar biosynthesis/type III secretory pathway protein FliH